MPHDEQNRRAFLKIGAAVGGAWTLTHHAQAAPSSQEEAQPRDTVRVALVGIGARGTTLLRVLLDLQGVEVKAVCDIIPSRVVNGQEMTKAAGQPEPTGYSSGETDFQRLCETEELDLVINAVRPWKWHVPICVTAMTNGKHTATEVPAAETLEGCWELVETAERTQKYCVLLENCCYFRNVMLIHNMLRQGLFGDLRHCEAGYQHYVGPRAGAAPRFKRDKPYVANSYPTHPIGPVAQWMDINRGNRFDYLVSMSADASDGSGDADINTSLIRTIKGQTITLYFDVKLPRPYDLIYRVQGTRGIYMATLDKIYVEGRSRERDAWEPMDAYYAEFENPLWKAWGEKALSQGGHGGADWMTLYRLIHALRTGVPPDIDVYDAATWSCITALSEQSVAHKSSAVDFPDFTRGRWRTESASVLGE